MTRRTTARSGLTRLLFAGALSVAAVFCGRALYAQQTADALPLQASMTQAAATDTLTAVPVVPARPTITAERAWASIEDDLACSPWLGNADEFAVWIDRWSGRCVVVTAATAEYLRQLNYLLNEHWIGKRATAVMVAGLGVTAAVTSETGVGLGAGALSLAIKTSPQWTVALADRADELSTWVEEATAEWERYAAAYERVDADPSAEHLAQWMDAAQALLPHLERGERVVAALNKHLATIDGHLSDLNAYLDGVDHWAVEWLADEVNTGVVSPLLERVDGLQPKLQMARGRLMVDQALVATMPLRFGHLDIVDAELAEAE